jgi:homogentisate 1,2-dioxygenase
MNVMSEFMGLLYGVYDAKIGAVRSRRDFAHSTMLPHGPDNDAFERATNATLAPHKLEGTLAFMFETRFRQRITPFAATNPALQNDYASYGHRLEKHFDHKRS